MSILVFTMVNSPLVIVPTPFFLIIHFNLAIVSPFLGRAVGGGITWRSCWNVRWRCTGHGGRFGGR